MWGYWCSPPNTSLSSLTCMPPLLSPDLHAQHCLDQSWNFQALVCPVSISLFVFLFLSTMDFPSGGVRSVHSLPVEPAQITPRCTRHLELSILWISFLDWRPLPSDPSDPRPDDSRRTSPLHQPPQSPPFFQGEALELPLHSCS